MLCFKAISFGASSLTTLAFPPSAWSSTDFHSASSVGESFPKTVEKTENGIRYYRDVVTPATLGYVLSPDGREVLMVHRNARPDDHQLGKYNGLGGKLERDEDVVAGMRREIHEEAGIEVRQTIPVRRVSVTNLKHDRAFFGGVSP